MTGRFTARAFRGGKRDLWGVFDTLRYSWPTVVEGRRVPHGVDKEQAQAVADRLNETGRP